MNKIDGPSGPVIPRPIEHPADADPRMPQPSADPAPLRPQSQGSAYMTSEEGQARRMEILNKLAASQPHTGGVDPYDDAYWAKQPPEVQKLRDVQDLGERTAMVSELVLKGYTIDVPIMLYGWGPHQTNQLRAAYGYTWVPSATMEGIIMAPGLHAPGYPDYDPNHPPPGAILIDANEVGDNPFKDYLKLPDYAQAPSASGPAPQASSPAMKQSAMLAPQVPLPQTAATPPKLIADSGKTTTIPEELLSTPQEAMAVHQRLESLGYDLKIAEQQPEDGQKPSYGKDSRRPFSVGGLNAGIVKGWYERMREEDANKLVAEVMKLKQ